MMVQHFIRPVLITFLFLAGIVTAAIILFYLKNETWPNQNVSLCNWDCGWYVQLRDNGYLLHPDKESNPAFFPLFSYLWRWTGFSFVQMSVFNAFLFVGSMGLLVRFFEVSTKSLVLFLSLGLITFFAIPYSEGLFFLGSSLFLTGMHKDHKPLTILGFAIAVLARSASIIFIAASVVLLIISLVQRQRSKQWLMLTAVFTTIITTLSVMYIQYVQTGNFFAFFYAQQFWDHHLGVPSFPLSSWHWPTHLSDSSGLLFGLIAIVISFGFCLPLIFKIPTPKLILRLFSQEPMDFAYLFSFLYLAGTTSVILLFQGGNIHSLNRYIFSTPFFLLLVHAFVSGKIRVHFSFVPYLIFGCVLGIFLPRQTYVEHYIFVTAIVIVIPTALLFQHRAAQHKGYNFGFIAGVIAGIALQVFLLSKYFEGNWMG